MLNELDGFVTPTFRPQLRPRMPHLRTQAHCHRSAVQASPNYRTLRSFVFFLGERIMLIQTSGSNAARTLPNNAGSPPHATPQVSLFRLRHASNSNAFHRFCRVREGFQIIKCKYICRSGSPASTACICMLAIPLPPALNTQGKPSLNVEEHGVPMNAIAFGPWKKLIEVTEKFLSPPNRQWRSLLRRMCGAFRVSTGSIIPLER